MSEEELAELQRGIAGGGDTAPRKSVVSRLSEADGCSRRNRGDRRNPPRSSRDVFDEGETGRLTMRNAICGTRIMEAAAGSKPRSSRSCTELGLDSGIYLSRPARAVCGGIGSPGRPGTRRPADYGLADIARRAIHSLRLEQTAVLRWMRERNALAWFLAQFQKVRLSPWVCNATSPVSCVAKRWSRRLPQRRRDSSTRDVEQGSSRLYRISAYARKRQRVAEIRADFPEFFASLEAAI